MYSVHTGLFVNVFEKMITYFWVGLLLDVVLYVHDKICDIKPHKYQKNIFNRNMSSS